MSNNILPGYFLNIREKLTVFNLPANFVDKPAGGGTCFLGGGTDLYVHQQDLLAGAEIDFLSDKVHLKSILQQGEQCIMGASVTVTDILESPIFQQYFPSLQKHMKLVSSTQIRNMATFGGNIINGSPIGDLTIFFLALDAHLLLRDGMNVKKLPLRNLFMGYKQLAKAR